MVWGAGGFACQGEHSSPPDIPLYLNQLAKGYENAIPDRYAEARRESTPHEDAD
jgi:hypothetical protein